ncbi:MAG TPA: THUMP domain-containing protein [Woeseiaceae bacterium]
MPGVDIVGQQGAKMPHDWNVVVTLMPEGYGDAMRILSDFGDITKTAFRDVLVMRIELNADEFQERVRELLVVDKTLANSVSRIVPVTARFSFSSSEEFRAKVQEAVRPWAGELAGKSFHVRMHRRGFHGELRSQEEERAIGDFLLRLLGEHRGTRVVFEDPDVVVAVETVGQEAGVSRWSRDELGRYELLRFD